MTAAVRLPVPSRADARTIAANFSVCPHPTAIHVLGDNINPRNPSLSLAVRDAIPIGLASKCLLTEKTHEDTHNRGNARRTLCFTRVGAKVKARFHRRAVRLRSATRSRVARRRHEWPKRPNHVGRFCQRERSRSVYQGIDGPWIRKYGRPLTA